MGYMGSHRRPQVARRLARIEGHFRGIRKMLDEGRSYSEIVHQVSAVKSSLDGVVQVIVEDLVEDCIARNERSEPLRRSMLELQQVIASSR
jgi:DNA-binding FrmR family transcriptional regulator